MRAEEGGGRVSVIIPAHNAARFIRETIAAAMAQSHRNLEIIVVDDGSSDNTAQIIEEMAAEDRRIILFRTSNCGVAAARNPGIKEARGELLRYLMRTIFGIPRRSKSS